ncbi:hypothetical protein GGQ22_19785 [Nocardioides sp. zg-579]|uniref:Uncharacterized protein n=1 Tax=Nocardioides marmotae TaxID=2663857 RepID=A0A6I3JGL9_9ACTN|nr:hypothetical protein [Nocardioides marmotae]MCR6033652.1 hypothetical protein [Gordonia jinghuaiqii]MTB97311.1 hypothetical protein [Nocardioides marmotae]QKE01788.1 hypothetical protein HPC71_12460 [Nocardioides marmotae]
MSDELSLFGDDDPARPQPPESAPAPIADWQVDLLRKTLDARGLTAMGDRQNAIELASGRSVDSLRALTHEEALRALAVLGRQATVGRGDRSAWDDRETDTWIDRL